MAVEIELAFAGLVPVPGNVEVNRVDAQLAMAVQGNFPEVARDAIVEKCGGMDEERLAVHVELGVTTLLNNFDAANCRRLLARVMGLAQSELSLSLSK
jgi:hypothetical protein